MKAKKLQPVLWAQTRIRDAFWSPRCAVNRTVTLPLQYELNRRNGVIGAHRWEWWDPAKGKAPWRIIVGDLGKWIEAAAYSLATRPDADLAAKVEEVVQSILTGQKADGYLFPNPMRREQVFANLQEYHELYSIGHEIEGAVAHWQATGRRHFLDAMQRAADLLDRTFGPEPGKKHGYDGHPEIELALVKLYRATGEQRHLKLAKYFVDERGREPNYFKQEADALRRSGLPFFDWYRGGRYDYCLAHKPLRRQRAATGHAVRALYLYSGAVDVTAETGDRELLAVCKRLWNSIVRRRMYVIGGVGSTAVGEAFTYDYDLPNETAYAETCANIALVFFAHRLLQLDPRAEYADVMERALYNGVLSGVSRDGRKFFYTNHLTALPAVAPEGRGQPPDAVALRRQDWFGCACCPPNVARLIASLGQYICSTTPQTLYVHLYIGGSVECDVAGKKLKLTQVTDYPWKGNVALVVAPESAVKFCLALRLPGWCRSPRIAVNGKTQRIQTGTANGYALIERVWLPGDRIALEFPMPVERVEAHPAVRMDCGKVALQRGPLVYCLEEADNGRNLADVYLPRTAKLTARFRPELLGGCVVIEGSGRRRDTRRWKNKLYRTKRSHLKAVDIRAVPYCLWANRRPGEMIVWIRGD
jgi:DUF1680 family protein